MRAQGRGSSKEVSRRRYGGRLAGESARWLGRRDEEEGGVPSVAVARPARQVEGNGGEKMERRRRGTGRVIVRIRIS